MQQALQAAQQAEIEGEVPIGAVIVDNLTNQVIAQGYNQRETRQDPLAHAEIEAITAACQKVGSWRLEHHSLFVTLEPCAMCAGAIINSRITNVIFGACDPKAGSVESLIHLFDFPYNSRPDYQSGVLAPECSQTLTTFFRKIRQQNS
ncbi:nucleoside deaminase [Lactobacillus sp. DCY120]|uniref:tRNA-specific adenosine deaminase n=2 Tax=Bombilactobacillus apium TaxID=2675299 RepID=A0A850QZ02_9LACO|nr:nucleoside deaminase [Bombilactobacillus apium]